MVIDLVMLVFSPNAQIDDNQRQMLHCCCNLMSSIPSDEYGTLLRHHMIKEGLLRICIDFLVAVAPEDALKDAAKLEYIMNDDIDFIYFLYITQSQTTGHDNILGATSIAISTGFRTGLCWF